MEEVGLMYRPREKKSLISPELLEKLKDESEEDAEEEVAELLSFDI